jgi:hypothetical protein
LVVSTPLKNINHLSHLGSLFPIYGKMKNVPNHQPVSHFEDLTWTWWCNLRMITFQPVVSTAFLCLPSRMAFTERSPHRRNETTVQWTVVLAATGEAQLVARPVRNEVRQKQSALYLWLLWWNLRRVHDFTSIWNYIGWLQILHQGVGVSIQDGVSILDTRHWGQRNLCQLCKWNQGLKSQCPLHFQYTQGFLGFSQTWVQ